MPGHSCRAIVRRRADRDLVLHLPTGRLMPVHEPLTERGLTARLADLARDPVGVRRELVDAGLLTRTRDGAEHGRTHVTEFGRLGVEDVLAMVVAAVAEEPQTPPGKPS